MLGRNLLGGIIVSFMFLAPASPSSVVTLYVNGETGKDSNNGTARDAPLKTILQAKEIVRSYLKSNASLPVDVRIAPGVYPVAAPLVFAGADSGASPAARVAYLPDLDASEQHRPRPAPVVLSGGYRLLNWVPATMPGATGWLVADLAAAPSAALQSRHFYVNGSHASRTEVRRLLILYISMDTAALK